MDANLQEAGRFLQAALRIVLWVLGTAWLGLMTILRVIGFLRQLGELQSEILLCPRGHENPAYGVFECTSASPVHLHEGWVFGRCRVCDLSAGYTPCQVCGLAILNPLLRRPS